MKWMMMLLPISLFAVDADVQFENDEVRVLKVKVMPHEEIAAHRDEYPQIIISFKGGTITRYDADGTSTEVVVPKNSTVFKEADPVGVEYKSANNTCKPFEAFVIQLKNSK